MSKPVRPEWYETELAWYVNEWEAESGFRGVSLEPGTGAVEDHDGVSDRALKAATRARRVERALRSLRARDVGHDPVDMLRLAHRDVSPRVSLDIQRRVATWMETQSVVIGSLVRRWRREWVACGGGAPRGWRVAA